MAQYTGIKDVVFGSTVTGRQVDIPFIDRIGGPTIATVPVRIKFDWTDQLSQFLDKIHSQATQMIPFEQLGLQRIQQLNSFANQACQFQSLLVVQSAGQQSHEERHSVIFRKDSIDDFDGLYVNSLVSYGLLLECVPHENGVSLNVSFDPNVVTQDQVQRIVFQLDSLLRQMYTSGTSEHHYVLSDLDTISPQDLSDIWKWNAMSHTPSEICVHELIADTTRKQPDALAIYAWDGQLTYHELDDLSDRLAYRLIHEGVRPESGSIIPLCFEKSMWTSVAMLGVMKAGAASVALDVTHPVNRLRSITDQVNPSLTLASVSSESLARSLCSATVILVSKKHLLPWQGVGAPTLPTLHPSQKISVIFTSGSTGTPKGAMMTHSNFATSISGMASIFPVGSGTRTFDFASYAFDIAWFNIVHTLAQGGCLCVPHESERTSDLEASLRRYQATFFFTTPTVARLLNPQALPNLQCLVLGGEAQSWSDFAEWNLNAISVYGPAECTVLSAAGSATLLRYADHRLPPAKASTAWVLELENDKLAPIGAIGELCIEGPLVGAGYLNDPDKTKAAFWDDPPWLMGVGEGRQGRVYKTGDLVRQNSDGTLDFMGRKDTQVKIRGQRVELREIEHHVSRAISLRNSDKSRENVQVLVEVLKPSDIDSSILAAFICPDDYAEAWSEARRNEAVIDITKHLEEVLSSSLPIYMVPNVYIPIGRVPMTSNGKTDRRRLRNVAAMSTLAELTALCQRERRDPSTEMEQRLQHLWSSVLRVSRNSISANDSFLSLGGDSIAAMRLVALAEEYDISLTVADIFRKPHLNQLAVVAQPKDGRQAAIKAVLPFSLLKHGNDECDMRSQSAILCGVDAAEVEDVYPCTPMQEGLLALTTKRAGDYIMRRVLPFHKNVDLDRFRRVWSEIVSVNQILRTRIIDLPGQGLVQVVISKDISWFQGENIDNYLQEDTQRPTGLGTALSCQGIVKTEDARKYPQYFVWTVHHALYDGRFLSQIFGAVQKLYRRESLSPTIPFRNFVQYVMEMDQHSEILYWQGQFNDLQAQTFPSLYSKSQQPQADCWLHHRIDENEIRKRSDFTIATYIRAAWSILQASYTGVNDVVFGAVASGRQAPISGVERIAGPTVTTVPIRVKFDWHIEVDRFLYQIQEQSIEMVKFEQTGIPRIRQLSAAAEAACEFQTLLLIQPAQDDLSPTETEIFSEEHTELPSYLSQSDPFVTFNLLLEFSLDRCGLSVKTAFDSKAVTGPQIQRMVHQFKHLLRQFYTAETLKHPISRLQLLSPNDLNDIWNRNATVPDPVKVCIHQNIALRASCQPDAPAISAWDGDMTYSELDDFSTRLAFHLVKQGVGRDIVVPLCFEKSLWTTVSILAVMKAGGASFIMDINQPEARLRALIGQFKPNLMLSSKTANETIAPRVWGNGKIIIVNRQYVSALPRPQSLTNLGEVHHADPLCVLFTSGSTGVPKAIAISHANFSTSIEYLSNIIPMGPRKRIFDFASYSFDIAWYNVLHTLVSGGCLCVPSEAERMGDLQGAISRHKATTLFTTPTVAGLLDPTALLDLQCLALGGEAQKWSDFETWSCQKVTVYGPAECTVVCAAGDAQLLDGNDHRLPPPLGSINWVVDVRDNTKLAPIGAVGELWLEGPLVSQGYINNRDQTSSSFIEDPSWLVNPGVPGFIGRKGRLYKTGDLVRYNEDGGLDFIGRKDTQIKLRGQRIELSEVEQQVQTALLEGEDFAGNVQVIVEVVNSQASDASVLMAFIKVIFDANGSNENLSDEEYEKAVQRMTVSLEERLAMRLPIYMIPNAYIPIQTFPITTNGKLNRAQLRELATLRPRYAPRDSGRPVQTKIECQLQDMWADILKLKPKPQEIHAGDSFLRLGGDSIGAMRLIAACRKRDLHLTAAEIFQHPYLYQLAQVIEDKESIGSGTSTVLDVQPYSLLRESHDVVEVRKQAAVLCGVASDDIEDVLPCTPIQESLLALTTKRPADYVMRRTLPLRGNINVPRFQEAWSKVVASCSNLRTRIIDLPGQGLVQAVTSSKHQVTWFSDIEIDSYVQEDEHRTMELGGLLTWQGLVRAGNGQNWFVWTMHHAVYDGWSVIRILQALEASYLDKRFAEPAPFRNFVQHVLEMEKDESQSTFWRDRFDRLEAQSFPTLPSPSYQPRASGSLTHRIAKIEWKGHDFTPATIIHGAWAVTLAYQTGVSDIVFGSTINGRQADIPTIERVLGPTIATVPIRLKFDWNTPVEGFLRRVQQEFIEMTSFEQVGLSRIQQLSPAAKQACKFQSLLLIQPMEDDTMTESEIFRLLDNNDERLDWSRDDAFVSFGLMLECRLLRDGVEIHCAFDPEVLPQSEVKRLLLQLGHFVQYFCNPGSAEESLEMINPVSSHDLMDIWNWNCTTPAPAEICVHDVVADVVFLQPNAAAVCAWDGELTYRELDEVSTRLAQHLALLGVTTDPETVIPLCFEKSMWTPVAMLAVMKAGGVSTVLDMNQPIGRLQMIIDQINPLLVLSSSSNFAVAQSFHSRSAMIVDADSMASLDDPKITLPTIRPSNALYVVFTSGSTGTPKGVVITHQNYASALKYQGHALGFTSITRTFDFTSYAWDLVWYNLLFTLAAGGCLCVPSEDERQNITSSCLQRYQASYIQLTPSVIRSIPEILADSGIKTLVSIGEPLFSHDLAQIRSSIDVKNLYGPSECTTMATLNNVSDRSLAATLGTGYGLNTWIVDCNNEHHLAPIGAIGELWLEGPLVGREYFSDKDKTANAFTNDPAWLISGGPVHPGRDGRLYKTGDLVRYNPDGNLVFIGRKDTQTKINGQRVDMGEVEHHVRQGLLEHGILHDVQVVAEVLTPQNAEKPILLAFVYCSEWSEQQTSSSSISATLREMTKGLNQRLTESMPSYMIPTSYIAIHVIPKTTTGKADRRQLREMAAAQTLQELTAFGPSESNRQPPKTPSERMLKELWAATLGIELDQIMSDDNFFQLGGDSIAAMRLVASANKHGISLKVVDIFRQPSLRQLGKIVDLANSKKTDEKTKQVDAFSLLKKPTDERAVRAETATLCAIRPEEVDDVFPCTPLQEGLLALTAKRSSDYVLQRLWPLHDDIDVTSFCGVWNDLVSSVPIFRTRIVDLPGQGLVQVIVKKLEAWRSGSAVESYLANDKLQIMGLGTPLAWPGLVTDANGQVWFILTIHHAIYDGWSFLQTLRAAELLYTRAERIKLAPFQRFVEYILHEVDSKAADAFWENQLSDLQAQTFPSLPAPSYEPQARQWLTHRLDVRPTGHSFTPTTAIRTAWSVLLAQHTGVYDVVFGATVTGRQAPVPDIEFIVGPTIATVPIRVAFDSDMRLEDLLHQLQRQATDLTAYEQIGLSRISRLSVSAEQACRFQSLVVVQSTQEVKGLVTGNTLFKESKDHIDNNDEDRERVNTLVTYSLLLECQPDKDGITFNVAFDPAVISQSLIQRLLFQLDHILCQIYKPHTNHHKIRELETASPQDILDIIRWNSKEVGPINACVHNLFLETASKQPDAPAICAWDGHLTYGQLNDLSNRLAHHLLELGIKKGSVIPLYFEKSMWTSVAVLGVMKAGGASVLMDVTQPENRLRTIVKQIKSSIIISSVASDKLARDLGIDMVINVGTHFLAPTSTTSVMELPNVSPSDTLCVLFTSGTTGTPKGTILTHSNWATSISNYTFPLGPGTRTFQFASHAFDLCWWDILHTLTRGGCLCVPSESERMGDLQGALSRHKATLLFTTPSVSNLLDPKALPDMQCLALGGEPLKWSDFSRWPQITRGICTYGPSECTPASGEADAHILQHSNHRLPPPVASAYWISNLDGTQPAPIGAIGQLWLEGPLVGQGYLYDPEKTATAFVEDPPWLRSVTKEFPSRRGHRRLYITGDLVRFNTDGSLNFLGRKDTQVKLRGQRIELSEVDHHIRKALLDRNLSIRSLQVVADVVNPRDSKAPLLIAFVCFGDTVESLLEQDLTSMIRPMVDGIEEQLASLIPAYMVPSAFLPIKAFPMTSNGKLDRANLRKIAESRSLEELTSLTENAEERKPPQTKIERSLQLLWARVLNVDADAIFATDSFRSHGGDSIAAMRLVAAARDQGLSLTVANIFRFPRLDRMASNAFEQDAIPSIPNVVPFSLIDSSENGPYPTLETIQGLMYTKSKILDILPCSSFQKLYVEQALQAHQQSIFHFFVDIPGEIALSDVADAWQNVVRHLDILRTVFVQYHEEIFQIILQDVHVPVEVLEVNDVQLQTETFCEHDLKQTRQFGSSLLRFVILYDSKQQARLVLRLCHAQYDGISFKHILSAFRAYLQGQIPAKARSFTDFIGYTTTQRQACQEYWRSTLQGAPFTTISRPVPPSTEDRPITVERKTTPPRVHGLATPAVIFTAACALMISRITQSTDVVFGRLVSGRSSLPADLQDVIGPCVNAVPVRVRLGSPPNPAAVIFNLQRDMNEASFHETLGLDEISANCTNWSEKVSLFDCLTQYHDIDDHYETQIAGSTWRLQSHGRKDNFYHDRTIIVTGHHDRRDAEEGEVFTLRVLASSYFCNEELATRMMEELCQALDGLSDWWSEPERYR